MHIPANDHSLKPRLFHLTLLLTLVSGSHTLTFVPTIC
jgi:hypothetical protein